MITLPHFRGITGPRVSITGEIIVALKMNRDRPAAGHIFRAPVEVVY